MIPAKPAPEVKLLSCPFCGAQPIGSADTWTVNHKDTCFMGEYTSLDYYSDIERWNRRASLEELAKRIEEAMNEITNLPVGAIGEGGPTIDELDAHVDATGHSWDDDAEYHTGQRAWRILEQAKAIVRQYTKEVRK